MSRSRHTDPRPLRATRRVAAPLTPRGVGTRNERRDQGQVRKAAGVAASTAESYETPKPAPGPALRIVVRRPPSGLHHPAGKNDVRALMQHLGPAAAYGLRTIELGGAVDPTTPWLFGRYFVPGRIVLWAQPAAPWRLAGLLRGAAALPFTRSGARLTLLAETGATIVDWPPDGLRRFMLEEVLLHELGHHVLQHDQGKRPARTARTRDHEASARRFAQRWRRTLRLTDLP